MEPSNTQFQRFVAAVLAEDERASGLAHDALVAGLNGHVADVVKRRLRELHESSPIAPSSDQGGSRHQSNANLV